MSGIDMLGGAYPTDWEGFIGQDRAKRQLMTAARSAKMRGATLDHVLLASGTPGLGKTSLALLVALEMEREIKIVSGKIPVNQARIAISGLEDGDILFYDEIHMAVSGGKGNAEWLLHLMQDGCLLGPTGPEKQPNITIIGATTDAGRLPPTIVSRFILKPTLVEYTDEEAALIAVEIGSRLFPKPLPFPTSDNFRAVASAACNNPRVMRSILTNVRDIQITGGPNWLGDDEGYDMSEALDWLGLTHDGLDLVARRYLVALLEDFAGGAGERALADRLQEPGGVGEVERVLMHKGLLAKTKQGRTLTGAGIKRARECAEVGVEVVT
jgi:Holliday junction DNA helicase RuvB